MSQRAKIQRQGLKFCGVTGGDIVACGTRGECCRIDEQYKLELASIIRANYHTLEQLLEELLRDCGPLTPCQVRWKAAERHGDVIGLLLQVMAQTPCSTATATSERC